MYVYTSMIGAVMVVDSWRFSSLKVILVLLKSESGVAGVVSTSSAPITASYTTSRAPAQHSKVRHNTIDACICTWYGNHSPIAPNSLTIVSVTGLLSSDSACTDSS